MRQQLSRKQISRVEVISQQKKKRNTNPTDRHLVGGESASLVRADDRRTAERLDRRQTSHDRVLLGHTSSAQSQTRGDDCRQTLWNSGNSQRHGDLEVVDCTLDHRTAKHAIFKGITGRYVIMCQE